MNQRTLNIAGVGLLVLGGLLLLRHEGAYTTQDVLAHVAPLVLGALFLDAKRVLALVKAVVPFGRKAE